VRRALGTGRQTCCGSTFPRSRRGVLRRRGSCSTTPSPTSSPARSTSSNWTQRSTGTWASSARCRAQTSCSRAEELSALRRACQGRSFEARRDAAIIEVLLAAGIRLSELAGIRYDPGDPARSDLRLLDREIRVRGKAGRERIVRIGFEAARGLDRYLRARARHPQAARPQLWLGAGGRGPLTPNGIYQAVARAGERAGVAVYPYRSGSRGALPRPGPLGTGLARFRASGSGKPLGRCGLQCRVPALCRLGGAVAGCVHQDEDGSASLRWRPGGSRDGFAGDVLAGDAEPPVFPVLGGGREVAGVDERAPAVRAAAVLPAEQGERAAVERGPVPAPPVFPVSGQVRVIGGMTGP
jgi:Phage integrase family